MPKHMSWHDATPSRNCDLLQVRGVLAAQYVRCHEAWCVQTVEVHEWVVCCVCVILKMLHARTCEDGMHANGDNQDTNLAVLQIIWNKTTIMKMWHLKGPPTMVSDMVPCHPETHVCMTNTIMCQNGVPSHWHHKCWVWCVSHLAVVCLMTCQLCCALICKKKQHKSLQCNENLRENENNIVE